ncbi:MAG: sulfatase/phosphatase domain-containing protein, partial [Anaerolineales bacterium]
LIKELGYQNLWALHRPQDVAEKASQFLTDKPLTPFFLKIGFEYPHRDENGRFKQAPPDVSLGVEVPPYLPKTPEAEMEFAEFQGVIKAMDEAVGQIWSALAQSGLLSNTWVIFTTDHGIAMPFAKCTLYDAGIETALIMYAEPFGLTGGKIIYDLISNVDLVPTILEMLDIDLPSNLQGQSFANVLREKPYQSRDEIFVEKTFHTAYEPQRAIRTKRYKLIWNVEAGIINVPGDVMRSPIYPQVINQVVKERPTFELYDLEVDPLEQNNLADNLHYIEIFDNLRQHLLNWMKDTQDPIIKGPLASPFFDQGKNSLIEPGE